MTEKIMRFAKQIGVNKKILLFLFFNFGILIFIMKFCQPVGETNDDFTMSLVPMGVFGDNYRQCLIFSNVIYGYIIKYISYLFPSLNWWIMLQYLIIVTAYSALFYLLSERTNISIALLCNMIVGCLVMYNEIRYIQFTRTAFIACIVGLILQVYGNIHNSQSSIVIGLIMCLMGSWIREKTFWICVVYIGAFITAYILQIGVSVHAIKKYVGQICIMILLVAICSFMNKLYYMGNTEWDTYREFNLARSNLLDYGMPSWAENQEKYESIGFSENDVRLFAKWNFNDSNKYTIQNLSEIVSWKTKEKIEIDDLKNLFKQISEKIQVGFFVVWLVSLIAVFAIRSKSSIVLCFLNFLGTLAIFFIFVYGGRMIPRLEFGIWTCAILTNFLGFFEFRKEDSDDIYKTIGSIRYHYIEIGAVLGMIIFLGSRGILYEGMSIYEGRTRDLLSHLTENSSNLYVLDISSLGGAYYSFCPYKRVDSFYLKNYCWSGGWDTFSPYWLSYNEVLGFDNPLEDLCTKDNVFYVTDRDISVMHTYLQENYKAGAVELVETYQGWNIYKFFDEDQL